MLLRRELTKLFAQKRTYVGWAGLLAVPLLVTLALYLNRNSSHHDAGAGGVINLAMHNGLLMPAAAMLLLSGFLLPLLASMAGSYQLAGEGETGTIKTWLMHSISRGGVLASKWGVAVIYMAIGLAIVAAGALLAGGLAFGLHAPVLAGQTVSVPYGLWLTLVSYLYVLAGVVCVLSLALLFATFTNSSLTAAIGALVVVIVLNIVGSFSYFDFLKPYLFTSHMDAWQNLFTQQPIDWHPMLTGAITFAVYIAALMAAAWYVFRRKDILV